MRIVVALGGNALLRRGEPLSAEVQRRNVAIAAAALAPLVAGNELVISHGNGPQVGLLALQGEAYGPRAAFPLDVLGAETEGMIGYVIEQELGNRLPPEVPLATLLTMVEVDADDPAFRRPTKFVGPGYERAEAERIAAEQGWSLAPDGARWRRVVPSPAPKRIVELDPIRWLLERGTVVICAGGGGIPTIVEAGAGRRRSGVEAVVDKDACSELLARELGAELLVMATDVPCVFLDFGEPVQRGIRLAHPDALDPSAFPAGSMGPKVAAACAFARGSGRRAAIGALADLGALVRGEAGTQVDARVAGLALHR